MNTEGIEMSDVSSMHGGIKNQGELVSEIIFVDIIVIHVRVREYSKIGQYPSCECERQFGVDVWMWEYPALCIMPATPDIFFLLTCSLSSLSLRTFRENNILIAFFTQGMFVPSRHPSCTLYD